MTSTDGWQLIEEALRLQRSNPERNEELVIQKVAEAVRHGGSDSDVLIWAAQVLYPYADRPVVGRDMRTHLIKAKKLGGPSSEILQAFGGTEGYRRFEEMVLTG